MSLSLRPDILYLVLLLTFGLSAATEEHGNNTLFNPIFPGWHSDPSCVFVPEMENTTFCVTSSFLNFPGLPIYSSKDLTHWRHVSNAFSRSQQVPWHASMNGNPRGGVWAPTIRYRDGKLYVIATYMTYDPGETVRNVVFETSNPFDDASWSNATVMANPSGTNHIDPDLFWDNDGKVYMATGWGKIFLSEINLQTGNASELVQIWEGSGGSNPEGPHIYKKDDYYYLIVAEGGAELEHSVTVARAKSIYGPYESYKGNPILTNRGTEEFFQSVGHADLFLDANGNWWSVALATRSGPKLESYPMGRETVLTTVTWSEEGWPVPAPVRGSMTGALPERLSYDQSGYGPRIDEGDAIDFTDRFSLPRHLVHFRSRNPDSYTISPEERPNTLRLSPSISNLTGSQSGFDPSDGVTFVGRRQTATKFQFEVDVLFAPKTAGEEAGITVFLSQEQHIDLSIVRLNETADSHLQFSTVAFGRANATVPDTIVSPVPESWSECPIRLGVRAESPDAFDFTAGAACGTDRKKIGSVSSDLVSGGFLGVYFSLTLDIPGLPRCYLEYCEILTEIIQVR